MADPTKYTVSYNFSNWQAINPTKPLPAQRVDIELANIQASIGQTIDGLKDIRRSDGKLKNGIVTPESLDPVALSGLTGAATMQAKQYRDEAAVSATSSASSATVAGNSAVTALGYATMAANSAATAEDLVEQASAGFIGFQDNQGYDFGSIATPTTYFDQNWGTL